MPTDTERRLEQLENVLLFGGGVAAGTASGRQLAAAAARRVPSMALGVARKHPIAATAFVAYVAHTQGVSLDTAQNIVASEIEMQQAQPQFFVQEQIKAEIREPGRTKRKVSKANKAVKHAMSLLKGGTKAATGADKGKLPRGAFKMAVKAAGLANPRTPSRVKGKGRIKNLARKLKRWW
ncbi:MAG TPA: hypothetical protein EYN67_15145 [Flavobacteriales bacterium]|nr:hypothetical protein [Flavobacteriales bacterium]